MGLSFKNWNKPSKWDFTGDTEAGEAVRDTLTGETAAEGARKQLEAAERAAAAGAGYIDEGVAEAEDVLTRYGGLGRDAYGRSFGKGQDALAQGLEQSRADISASPNRLAELYGGGLGAGFETDPGYQFRLQQGQNAITHAASAAGGRHGGDTLKALAEYNQNFASNEFDRYAQRQMGLAGGADTADFARQSSLANMASGYGQSAAGMYGQFGEGMLGSYQGQGAGLSDLYSGTSVAKANLGMAPVQYAGGAETARANARGQLLSFGAQTGAAYLGSRG